MAENESKKIATQLSQKIYAEMLSGRIGDSLKDIKNCDVNYQDSEGVSLLMIAGLFGYVNIMDALLKEGALTGLMDDNGNNILHYTTGCTLPKAFSKNKFVALRLKGIKNASIVYMAKLTKDEQSISDYHMDYSAELYRTLIRTSNVCGEVPYDIVYEADKRNDEANNQQPR